jgi:hypothetical protein
MASLRSDAMNIITIIYRFGYSLYIFLYISKISLNEVLQFQ